MSALDKWNWVWLCSLECPPICKTDLQSTYLSGLHSEYLAWECYSALLKTRRQQSSKCLTSMNSRLEVYLIAQTHSAIWKEVYRLAFSLAVCSLQKWLREEDIFMQLITASSQSSQCWGKDWLQGMESDCALWNVCLTAIPVFRVHNYQASRVNITLASEGLFSFAEKWSRRVLNVTLAWTVG